MADEDKPWLNTPIVRPSISTDDGGARQPPPGSEAARTANSGASGFIDSLGRQVAQGITFGFGDELAAAGDAAIGHYLGRGSQAEDYGKRYEQNLAAERARDTAFQSAHPVASTTANIAGGVAGILAAPELGAERVWSGIAAPINRFLANAPSWLRSTAGIAGTGTKLATEGAVQGGVAGFGEGEGGLDSRLASAGAGGVTGAILGPVAGAALSGASTVAGRVGETLGVRNPQTNADRQILRSFDRGGTNVEDVATRLAAGGDAPLALVDVGGRNTVNLGATAANTPSTAMDVADRFVQDRRAGRPERLAAGSDQAFGGGSGTDVADTAAGLRAQRSAEAPPLYKESFGKPAGMTQPMQEILQHPIGQVGLKQGLEIQGIENATRRARGEPEVPTHDPAIRYDENGDPRIVGVPNMRTLDAVKRGMDAMIDTARSDTTGQVQWTERLHAIDDMRRTWVGLLDQNNPEYAAARAAWGGPSAQLEGMAAGRKALTADRDVVAQRMQAAPDVQEAYRVGAGRQFTDLSSDPATAVNFSRRMAENRTNQQRLQSILPEQQLNDLNILLRRERDMGQVEQSVSPRAGAQTRRLLAGSEDMGRDPVGPILAAAQSALKGEPFAAGKALAGEAYRRIGQGINASTSDALANRLFTTDPEARGHVLDALRNRLMQDQVRAAMWGRVLPPALQATQRTAGGYAGRP